MIGYLVASLAWGSGGFVLGYMLGRTANEVRQIREAVVSDSPPTRQHRPFGRLEGGQILGLILVLLAVGSVVAMTVQINERQSQIECRAEVLDDTIRVLDRRAQIAGQDRAALDEFMASVFSLEADERATRRAYLTYTRTIAGNAEQRSGLSYPADRCGG